ncbi:MAG: dTDP-4-dehydrorhamnose reductase [Steroidobacteraceae bacterium]|jgi:dTDP-4-dehydrorhamnose reductase
MRVLITGASGQVGTALLRSVPLQTELHALTHQQLDISDSGAVRAAVSAFEPQVILNAAAYTAVDKAESEPFLADAINAQAPQHLAEAAQSIDGCRMIQISTDYVFDGRATEPYRPGDAPHPLSVYGRTKLAGEQAVLEVLAERAVVLRTAWVYAAQGKNFLLTMLRLMRERGAVRVVADQKGTPTAAASIARALWRIAELPRVHGVLHWTDDGVASWYEFASAIAEDALAAGLLSQEVEVTPIVTADYPTAAHRPANSVLDTRESAAQLGLKPEHWRPNLRATLAELPH